ncbi:fatty-acyl coenzyme A oxidase, partial [Phlyctochytrium planicorne]
MLTDIERERNDSSFNPKAMQVYLDGGIEASNIRDLAHILIQRDPILMFKDGHHFDMTVKEMKEKTMAQIRRYVELKAALKNPKLSDAVLSCLADLSDSFAMRVGVHEMLFKTVLNFFSGDDQREELLRKADHYEMLGCFAMTELGHSSSLRDLETVATLDKERDEWVILSPTLTSIKWWIGMAGQTANHTVLIAQTMVNGNNIGLNWFLVPLRDRNGRLLPTVTAGDCGAKAGRPGLDNGWIQFSGTRIPRQNMLMKWCSVDKDGEVSGPAHPAIMYAPLIPERLTLTFAAWKTLGKALTIACRYGVTRRQGPVNQQIIDYPAQQFNLLPNLAGIYVLRLVEWRVLERWRHIQELSSKDESQYIQQLPDIHATSAGLKAVITWWAADVLELCRRACGGHAYSSYNAIADLIGAWGVMTTGGGDNFPMTLQCSRLVLLLLEQGKDSGISAESLDYLSGFKPFSFSGLRTDAEKKKALLDTNTYVQLFRTLTVLKGHRLLKKVKESKARKEDPWNENQTDLIDLTKYHVYAHTLSLFAQSRKTSPFELGPALDLCGHLYAADLARQNMAAFIEEKIMSPEDSDLVMETVRELCLRFRKDAVAYTDALGFPDFILMAPIGRADGNIYQEYFQTVVGTNPVEVAPYWDKEIGSLLRCR